MLAAGLTGREITIIRAIARYLRQAAIPFSDRYMERTLLGNPEITVLLVALFNARFDPDRQHAAEAERLSVQIEQAIDAVESLDEDRILRSFLSVMRAMLRTNYFRIDQSGARRSTCRSSSTRRSLPCCRSRARGLRSSSIRRESRGFICAAARSRAGGCAGRTGGRISGPRCWG